MKDRRRTLFWVLLVSSMCAFALSMGYRWFERGGAFDLETVRVRGIRQADSAVVCRVVAPLFGTSIWQIDTDLLRRELTGIPGIDSARVSRIPLGTLVLDLSVSRPAYSISYDDCITVISSMGEVLPERFICDSLPVVEAEGFIGPEVSARLAGWFGSCGFEGGTPDFSFNTEGLAVLLEDGSRVLLGTEDFQGRWSGYLAAEDFVASEPAIREIDMRYAGQAVLRPLSGHSAGEVVQ
ncbi:MAG: hypothetical protein AVO35_06990 [Candidatus Aegiribacteria sp. MLS_C]|nr:MAG: hypothetical protein AVO35_06990 [Candidatus Aegiribacteria sp. MLS_C]